MAPLCICNGVIRSGSTWSFNVCRELFKEQALGSNQKFGSTYLDSQPLEQFITRQWPSVDGLTVIKAHNMGVAAMTVIRKGLAKAVCTYRDPRDCIASDLAFMNYPFEICIKRISSTLAPIRVYQSTPNILLVRYEDMMSDRLGEIRRIANHLGSQIDDAALHRIDGKTNLESSRRFCEDMKHRPADKLLKIDTHLVDPETHLHANHVNGGTVGRWKTELSSDQAAYVSEYFAPWLLQLGYETPASLQAILKTPSAMSDPVLPTQMPLQQVAGYGTFTVGAGASTRFASS